VPAWVSPVATTTSKVGWAAQIRNSSAPLKPEAPSIPMLAIRGSYSFMYGHATCWLGPVSGGCHHDLAGHLAVGDVLERPRAVVEGIDGVQQRIDEALLGQGHERSHLVAD